MLRTLFPLKSILRSASTCNLTGQLPPEWHLLTNLRYLSDLSSPIFSGSSALNLFSLSFLPFFQKSFRQPSHRNLTSKLDRSVQSLSNGSIVFFHSPFCFHYSINQYFVVRFLSSNYFDCESFSYEALGNVTDAGIWSTQCGKIPYPHSVESSLIPCPFSPVASRVRVPRRRDL